MTMTKLNIQSMGDEFFCPDDSHYWLTEMKGPMFLRLLPNAEHSTALSGKHKINLRLTRADL